MLPFVKTKTSDGACSNGIKPQLCDGWRDAKKESPEEEGYYLIYWRGNIEKEYWYNDKYGKRWGYNKNEVIAWRPLPDPPAFA